MFSKRKCPCCGAPSNKEVVVATELKPQDIRADSLVQYWSGFFKEKSIFDYVRCEKCTLLFNNVYFNQKQLDELYGSMAPNMDVVPADAINNTQLGYFNVLKKYATLTNGYLELGPDVGHFLKHVVKAGKNKTIYLVEPNSKVHSELAGVCSGKKYNIMCTIDEIDTIEDKSLSEVVMIQVLDHLIHPIDVLKKIHKKLARGGVVVTVTHNEKSLMARLLGSKWPAYCMQHPQVYNTESITKIFNNSGYKIETIEKTKNYFQLGFLLKHAAWLFGVKLNANNKFFNSTVGLKLGNIITVAQKL